MSFADTSLLMARQKVAIITGWEASTKQLEAWGVVCTVFLGNASVQPVTYEFLGLFEEATGVEAILQGQSHRQTTFLTDLLCSIQM